MIRTLQSLRFFFIMLVVISHYIGKSFDFGGECGVSFFFILSGFVLSFAYSEKITMGTYSTKSLVTKQLTKIYPLHLATFLFMYLLDLRISHDYDISVIIPTILLLQSWFPADRFYFVANGSSWFLCDMLFFYTIFALLNKYLLGNNKRTVCYAYVVALVVYICLIATLPDKLINPILYANPLTRLLDFSFGILIFKFYQSEKGTIIRDTIKRQSAITISMTEAVIILSVVLIAILYPHCPQRIRTASLFWLVIPSFIFFFSISDNSRGAFSRFLHQKPIVWLGNLSFTIYLIHMPVFRVVNNISIILGITPNSLTHFSISVSLLIFFSYFIHIITQHCALKIQKGFHLL